MRVKGEEMGSFEPMANKPIHYIGLEPNLTPQFENFKGER